MVLNIEGVWALAPSWKDGMTQGLEDVLNEVIVGLIEAALYKKAQGAERETGATKGGRGRATTRHCPAAVAAGTGQSSSAGATEEATEEHQRLREFGAR